MILLERFSRFGATLITRPSERRTAPVATRARSPRSYRRPVRNDGSHALHCRSHGPAKETRSRTHSPSTTGAGRQVGRDRPHPSRVRRRLPSTSIASFPLRPDSFTIVDTVNGMILKTKFLFFKIN